MNIYKLPQLSRLHEAPCPQGAELPNGLRADPADTGADTGADTADTGTETAGTGTADGEACAGKATGIGGASSGNGAWWVA